MLSILYVVFSTNPHTINSLRTKRIFVLSRFISFTFGGRAGKQIIRIVRCTVSYQYLCIMSRKPFYDIFGVCGICTTYVSSKENNCHDNWPISRDTKIFPLVTSGRRILHVWNFNRTAQNSQQGAPTWMT